MNNFIFANKTKVYFGKGGVREYLGSLLQSYGDTVMLAYGRESAKRAVADSVVTTAGCCKKLTADEIYEILLECR